MMSNNKILTVSYGTFSCTLEGFDDSFGTMKAIAEYFRELSSDAPYFGAEPPQPDADMLARIAQKEVSRRVEAREHDGKIHLSAIENHTATAPQPMVNTGTGMLAQAPAIPESETAKTETDQPTAKAPDAAAPNSLTRKIDGGSNEIVPGQPDAEVEAFFANTSDASDTEDETEEFEAELTRATTEEIGPRNESIAAKLHRIRSVVSQKHNEHAQEKNEPIKDLPAQTTAPETDTAAEPDTEQPATEPEHLVADARRDIEEALAADDSTEDIIESEAEDDDDDIAAILGRLGGADDAEPRGADEDIVAAPATSDEPIDGASLNNLFDDDADDDAETDADISADAAPDAQETPEDEAAASTPKHAPLARVIKVKRADLEAAVENGKLKEIDGLEQENNQGGDQEDTKPLDALAPAKVKETSLSPEEEAELARELTDLDADLEKQDDAALGGLDDDDDQDADVHDDAPLLLGQFEDAESETSGTDTSRQELPSFDSEKGNDMDRLMAETNQQMDEPESATRRNAFSHLRAAVAAKNADVAMGAPEKADDKDDAYRSDLADVVRPRRPVSSGTRSTRPGEGRPAPLKLVAEQRVDVEQPRPAGPVHPRRVAAASKAPTPESDSDSFADYAAEMGATKLPQLLEAAAAYMSFVEGRAQFSRPQLMTKVRQVGPEDGFSREDGLRSFGQLLRTGKIEKIKGGRFTVSEDIGYRPDHRAAG